MQDAFSDDDDGKTLPPLDSHRSHDGSKSEPYVHACMCIYVFMHVCMYVCMYVYDHEKNTSTTLFAQKS